MGWHNSICSKVNKLETDTLEIVTKRVMMGLLTSVERPTDIIVHGDIHKSIVIGHS